MPTESWKRLEAIFHRARSLPSDEWSDFVQEVCRDDQAMRQEVESLLLAYEASVEFLARPPADLLATEPAVDPLIGRQVGAYRIRAKLGAGGMSVVYRAHRADQEYEQEVAIKLVDQGPAGPFASRLRRERQILARLTHPHVARLFDGGTTQDGRPFFVMELIEGEPIHRYCDHRRLDIKQRLDLFRQVGAAVRYAHQNLVLHCDLKPSNILVLADGSPKLLDFGIAKVLDPARFPGSVEVTQTRFRPLTPGYASPEQRRGERLTVASDVYSLGVVLYQLLTGQLPAESQGGEQPRPPSAAVAALRADSRSAERLAHQRRSTPARLHRRLARDLDSIVLAALHHEPEGRYPSVEALLDDLRRHEAGLPIRARRGSPTERLGKFLRRNWLQAASITAFALLLAGFAASTAMQRRQIVDERDKAERVSDFMIELFRVNDPTLSRGNTVTARELMDAAVARIDTEMEGQPEVQGALLDATGRIYLNLGLYDQAEYLTGRGLDLRRSSVADRPVAVAESLTTRGEVLNAMGRYGAAVTALQEAAALRREAAGSHDPSLAQALTEQIEPLVRLGRFAVAEERIHQAMAIHHTQDLPDRTALAQLSAHLGFVLASSRSFSGRARARSLYQRAIPVLDDALGHEAPDVLAVKRNLASLLRTTGEFTEAERLFLEVLASERRIYNSQHPQIGFTLNHFGLMLSELGRYDEAEALLRESLAVRRASLDASHPAIGISLNGLGTSILRHGRDPVAAEELFRQSLEILSGGFGPEHILTSYPLHGLARALIAQGRAAEAVAPLRRALVIRQTELPAGDAGILIVRRDLDKLPLQPSRL
ncbi:MAG: serine/threonine-protein kinase [Acidobacteriota bacterium]